MLNQTQLMDYLNDPKYQDIGYITEDTLYTYFGTDNIGHPMILKALGFKTWIKETKHGYHVRVLKPNWEVTV